MLKPSQHIFTGGCEVKSDVKLAARCTAVVRMLAQACQRPALDLGSPPLELLASPMVRTRYGVCQVWEVRLKLPAHTPLLTCSRAQERSNGARQVANPEHVLRAAQDCDDQLAGHGRHGWQARARLGRGGRAGSAPLRVYL